MESLMVKIINYGFVLTLAAFASGAHASETEPAVQLPNVSNSNNSLVQVVSPEVTSAGYKQYDIAAHFDHMKGHTSMASYEATGKLSIPELLVSDVVVVDPKVVERVAQEKALNETRREQLSKIFEAITSVNAVRKTDMAGDLACSSVLVSSPLFQEKDLLTFLSSSQGYIKREASAKKLRQELAACDERKFDKSSLSLSFDVKKSIALGIYQQRVDANVIREQYASLLRIQSASSYGTEKIEGLNKTGFELLEEFFAAKTARSLLKRAMLENMDEKSCSDAAKEEKKFSLFGKEAHAKKGADQAEFLSAASRLCLFDDNSAAAQQHAMNMYHLYKHLGRVVYNEVLPAMHESGEFASGMTIPSTIKVTDGNEMITVLSSYLNKLESKWRGRLAIDQTALDVGTSTVKALNLTEALGYYKGLAGLAK
jgi:hypothetical protein